MARGLLLHCYIDRDHQQLLHVKFVMSSTRIMAFFIFFCFTASFLTVSISSPLPINSSTAARQEIGQDFIIRSTNTSQHRRMLDGDCGTGNPVDDCWRCDPSWADNRQHLADCAVGFGRDTGGGKNGRSYVVTDPGDAVDPAPGTLRYGLTQDEPLWITFARDMTIRPNHDLLVRSHKTIDGRGAAVVVGDGGACLVIHDASNVIVHGITVRGCKPARTASGGMSDGDGINVLRATDVWIDHCTVEYCTDGLIDVTEASTRVTLSNNLLRNHDKAVLLGHSDDFTEDKDMKVNRFGPGLVQRMPRCRFGLFHVINNDYINWQICAIGGSAAPTILSHGNRFLAGEAKEVTKRDGTTAESEWSTWTWISEGDMLLNGAFFRPSGSPGPDVKTPSFAKSVSLVSAVTDSVGVLSCKEGSLCMKLDQSMPPSPYLATTDYSTSMGLNFLPNGLWAIASAIYLTLLVYRP